MIVFLNIYHYLQQQEVNEAGKLEKEGDFLVNYLSGDIFGNQIN